MTPGTRQRTVTDDQGTALVLGDVTRVVSLVPSLTEAIAVTAPRLLVGATDWCTHPAGLDVVRVRGTKNPDTGRIAGLLPDLVVANEEENRVADLEVLRQAGVPVWVTEVRTVDQAFDSLERLLTVACGLPRPLWLDEARDVWGALPSPGERGEPGESAERGEPGEPGGLGGQRRAIVPIWRRPWMVLGRDTFAGDVLRRLGVVQLYADHAERYPAVPLEELRACGADLVVLPDEPYRFTAADGPEAFPGIPAALVSGRHLTWYGPSLCEAPSILAGQLSAAR